MGKIVQLKKFVNETEETINDFLSKIPVEDIVSTEYYVVGYEEMTDEFVGIFYRTDGPKSRLDKLEEVYKFPRIVGESDADFDARLKAYIDTIPF